MLLVMNTVQKDVYELQVGFWHAEVSHRFTYLIYFNLQESTQKVEVEKVHALPRLCNKSDINERESFFFTAMLIGQ